MVMLELRHSIKRRIWQKNMLKGTQARYLVDTLSLSKSVKKIKVVTLCKHGHICKDYLDIF